MNELTSWYLKIQRPLPWRKNHDPYRIWISEIMLQQTQVETVIDYYERFLKNFPSLQSLAESNEQEVLTLWSGLGYYRRARNLRLGAQYLQNSLGGSFPKTREEMLEVPGIGPYTAGAILSIAFDLPEPLVDGNVQRVFARFYGISSPIQESQTQKLFWRKASEEVIKSKSPRVHNQALMELGSLICKKGTPLCEKCPISRGCVAFKKGIQTKLPVSKSRPPNKDLHWIGMVPKRKLANGQEIYLIKQNINSQWWDGLWDFPWIEKPLGLGWEHAPEVIKKRLRKKVKLITLNHLRHQVTHHRIQMAPFVVEIGETYSFKLSKPKGANMEKWLTPNEIAGLPLSALAKKIFRQLPL